MRCGNQCIDKWRSKDLQLSRHPSQQWTSRVERAQKWIIYLFQRIQLQCVQEDNPEGYALVARGLNTFRSWGVCKGERGGGTHQGSYYLFLQVGRAIIFIHRSFKTEKYNFFLIVEVSIGLAPPFEIPTMIKGPSVCLLGLRGQPLRIIHGKS